MPSFKALVAVVVETQRWRFSVNLIVCVCRGDAASVWLHLTQRLLSFSRIEEIYRCVCVYHQQTCQTNTQLCSNRFVKYYLINLQGVVSLEYKSTVAHLCHCYIQ